MHFVSLVWCLMSLTRNTHSRLFVPTERSLHCVCHPHLRRIRNLGLTHSLRRGWHAKTRTTDVRSARADGCENSHQSSWAMASKGKRRTREGSGSQGSCTPSAQSTTVGFLPVGIKSSYGVLPLNMWEFPVTKSGLQVCAHTSWC